MTDLRSDSAAEPECKAAKKLGFGIGLGTEIGNQTSAAELPLK